MKKLNLKIILPVVIILPPIIYNLYIFLFPPACKYGGMFADCTFPRFSDVFLSIYYFGLGLDLAFFIVSFYFFKKKIKIVALIILIGALGLSLFYIMPLLAPVYNYIKGPIIEGNYLYGAPSIVNDKFKSLVSRNSAVSVSNCEGVDKENIFYTIENKNNRTGSIEYFFYDGDVSLTSRPVCSESKPLYHTEEREGTNAMEQDFYDLFNIYD
jgi:hypothetical protein